MALAAVFSSSPPTDWSRQLADRYLTTFQSTPIAWMVCDRLLSSLEMNHRFFAAQTLHTKCQTDILQLPPDSHASLRDSLVNNVSDPSQSSVVRTFLAMAVAALAVQMSWTTIVTDLLQTNNATLMHTVLQVLPEECASDRLILRDENRRYQMRDHLIQMSHLALQDGMGLDLWHRWIKYVPIPPLILAQSVVPDATLQALQSPEHMESAIDVLVELLRMYPSHVLSNHELVNVLLVKLLGLPVALLESDDEDVVRGYCRIMTEMGESYLSLVCENPAHVIVERILKCTSINDTDISGMTLHFWYRFTNHLEEMEPLRLRQELVDSYTPHLLQLLDILLKHLQYPQNVEELSSDRMDDLHRDRYYIGDTLEDCCRLLGGHVVLTQIGQGFLGHVDWQPIEACLFAIQSIHRYIPQDEAQYLPHVMNLLPQLPPDIMTLRFTASAMIGKYAFWLAAHANHLQPLLPYLAEGLTRPECARAASVAIKELCECISLGDSMLELYSQVQMSLELPDELELLEGVCRTVSRQNPDGYLARIVQPLGNRWSEELSKDTPSLKQLVAEVERLAVIIRFLQVGGPALMEVVKSSWTLLKLSTDKFPRDFRLAESVCRLHKHAIRVCTPPVYAPLFDSLTQVLVESFDRSYQSPYLYCASICVTEYGSDPAYTIRLLDMITALSQTTFGFLQSVQDFVLHPDVVEEFFYLMGRMMTYCPAPLVASPLLPSLFQCAIVGMQLDHRDANRGTLNFLEAAVTRVDTVHVYLPLETVVSYLMRSLVGELPAYSIDSGSGSIAGILFKLNEKCPQPLREWVAEALQTCAPPLEGGDFLLALDASQDREEFNVAVRVFRTSCERHRKLQLPP
jgi:transportin-3